ncbi:MAG: TlpA family protein disulfide reductase [Armatimonadota bacterium]
MKPRYLTLLLIAVLLLAGTMLISHYRASAAEPTKKPLELTFPQLDGKPLKLADYRGKVVVLDVWATWCGYCVREMPELIEFQQEAEKKKQPVQLIGISVDRDKDVVAEFVKEHEIEYPMAMGDQKSLKDFGTIRGIPIKFIINKKGVIVDKIVGATDKETLQKKVEKYVKEKYVKK